MRKYEDTSDQTIVHMYEGGLLLKESGKHIVKRKNGIPKFWVWEMFCTAKTFIAYIATTLWVALKTGLVVCLEEMKQKHLFYLNGLSFVIQLIVDCKIIFAVRLRLLKKFFPKSSMPRYNVDWG